MLNPSLVTLNQLHGTKIPDRAFDELYLRAHHQHGDKFKWDSPRMKEGDTSAIELHLSSQMQ